MAKFYVSRVDGVTSVTAADTANNIGTPVTVAEDWVDSFLAWVKATNPTMAEIKEYLDEGE